MKVWTRTAEKQTPPLPWSESNTSAAVLVTLNSGNGLHKKNVDAFLKEMGGLRVDKYTNELQYQWEVFNEVLSP